MKSVRERIAARRLDQQVRPGGANTSARLAGEAVSRIARGLPLHAEHALALQRWSGNRAATRVLQRSFRKDAHGGWLFDFTVGSEISGRLAEEAFTRTRSGPLDDDDLAVLRTIALERDRTIDDNERLFLAALLDPANAKQLHTLASVGDGSKITFAGSSITAANRERVRDFGRNDSEDQRVAMHLGGKSPSYQDRIMRLAGRRFAAAAKEVVELASSTKVPLARVYEAMLAAASDSTDGDRTMAGAVYVIARRAGLAVADDLLSGAIKVDEVPPSEITGTAEYVSMSTLDRKGDTIYIPSNLEVGSTAYQGLVVHELTHAARDKAATGLVEVSVGDTELEGYRAQARYWLHELKALRGAALAGAIATLAPKANKLSIYAMMVEDRANSRESDVVLIDQLNRASPFGLSESEWSTAFGASNEELERLARGAILASPAYGGKQGAVYGGLRGESFLDE